MSHTTLAEGKAESFVVEGGAKTISGVDAALRSWILAAAPEVIVSFSPPALREPPAAPEVSAWLYEIKPQPVLQPARGVPELRVTLSYLVTVVGTDDPRSHDILHSLLLAAVNASRVADTPPWTLASDLPGHAFWLALGVPPQPCVILTTQLKLAKTPPPVAPPVQEVITRVEPTPVPPRP